MKQHTEILTVRVTPELKEWLSIVKNKYRRKRADFIRDAIEEKMRRDVNLMREELKEKLPF